MTATISLEPTLDEFAEYGELIEQYQTGAITRFEFANNRLESHVDLLTARPEPLILPLPLTRLERHRHSSQAFVPLGGFDYLVVVARDNGRGEPDLATLKAFRLGQHCGVNLPPDTWHRSVAALGEAGSFATVTCYDGTPDDIDFFDIEPVTISGP